MSSSQAILFLIVSAPLWAASQIQIYKFGTLSVAFVEISGFLVNKGCAQGPCEALKKAREFKKMELPTGMLEGGKNPEAVRCKSLMGGDVLIGLNEDGNEQSFCRFRDGSFLR